MAEFIREGYLDLHINKMKNAYMKRKNKLIESLKDNFGNNVSIYGAEAGLHLMASFKGVCFDENIMEKIKSAKVEVTPVYKHYLANENNRGFYENSLILGYGNTEI